MGHKLSMEAKKKQVKMSKETKEMYYRAEFKSMGDVLNDGRLNKKEFFRLLILLGLPNGEKGAEDLWGKQQKVEMNKMRVDEYIQLMSNPKVDASTSMWRNLFAQFDTDGSGYASRGDVVEGLENMGIPVGEEMRAKINAMDADKDGRICYGDFLKMQLLNK